MYLPKEKIEESTTPAALVKYLDAKPQIKKIFLHFDNDNAGRKASLALKTILPSKYEVIDSPPPVSYTHLAAQGFEETNLPDSFFDAVVGNVPFGDCLLYTSRCV